MNILLALIAKHNLLRMLCIFVFRIVLLLLPTLSSVFFAFVLIPHCPPTPSHPNPLSLIFAFVVEIPHIPPTPGHPILLTLLSFSVFARW